MVKQLNVGIVGYKFMGKAHSNAFKKLPYMMYPPPAATSSMTRRQKSRTSSGRPKLSRTFGTPPLIAKRSPRGSRLHRRRIGALRNIWSSQFS